MGGIVSHMLTLLALVLTADSLGARSVAQQPAFRSEYVVEVSDTTARLFHVTSTFSGISQPSLEVSLPVWMPGAYRLEWYARNMRRLRASDEHGRPIPVAAVAPSRWRVDSRGRNRVTVEFDYRADVRAPQHANVTGTYAFFTGVQLFLLAEGHRSVPATVHFRTPHGWRIATALRETNDSSKYTAANYDELVDAPTWLGTFESRRFEVDGNPHYMIWEAAGRLAAVPTRVVDTAVGRMSAVIRTQSAVFGGLPYDKYMIFRTPGPSPTASGAIEHGNSFVSVHDSEFQWIVNPHEFFHVWNVKRIRPAEMWPYDYSKPNVTPSLWFAEGVTSYYDNLTRVRAGLLADTSYLDKLAFTISRAASHPAAGFVSPSDASLSVWLGSDHYSYWSYYSQGEILGALLDIMILHDTQGRRGLDDVMRVLYREHYQKHRGVTPGDILSAVNSVSGRNYTNFFRRYVTGTDTPPYDSIFSLGLDARFRHPGLIFARQTVVPQGRRIDSPDAGGPAAKAGLRAGDIITHVDGAPVNRDREWCCRYVDSEGERSVLTVLRDGATLEVQILLSRGPKILELRQRSNAGDAQSQVGREWLARTGATERLTPRRFRSN